MSKRSRKASRSAASKTSRPARAKESPAPASESGVTPGAPLPTDAVGTPARPSRWPLVLLGVGMVTSFVGLILARYLPGRQFLYGLLVTGAGLGLAAASFVALLLGPRLFRPGPAGAATAALAGAAAGLRLLLVASRPNPAEGPVQVVMWREILLGAPIALAASALVLGAWAVHRTIALPPGGLAPRAVKLDLGLSVLGLAAALYTLGPLFRSFGFPLNHWTFLGLVGLGFAAFLVVSLLELVFGRRQGKAP